MPEYQKKRNFLGKGVRFPFQFTQRTGGVFKGTSVSASEEVQHITESILQILGTAIQSRVIRRDFGSELRGIVFEPNDPALDTLLDYMIRTAIEKWEPRVIIGPILIDQAEWKIGRLEINVNFHIIKTNTDANLVFPYFLSEEQRATWTTPGAP